MNEWVTDYQGFVNVGGRNLWMTFETGVATSWVMSVACFNDGCKRTPLFAGMFIPIIPPMIQIVDLLERGFLQIGTMLGLLGHSMISFAGAFCFGCPIAMAILEDPLSQTISEMSFNHSGAIGLGFWEDNQPQWLNPMDPALSMIKFMMCGNICAYTLLITLSVVLHITDPFLKVARLVWNS